MSNPTGINQYTGSGAPRTPNTKARKLIAKLQSNASHNSGKPAVSAFSRSFSGRLSARLSQNSIANSRR